MDIKTYENLLKVRKYRKRVLSIKCPFCNVEPGNRCRTVDNLETSNVHCGRARLSNGLPLSGFSSTLIFNKHCGIIEVNG
jgi:hypothetical protein